MIFCIFYPKNGKTMARAVFYLFIGMLASGVIQAIEQPEETGLRDLIVILDDRTETNPSKTGFCICELQNALQAEIAPILISESLWRTFIEARQEWEMQAKIPGTSEYKITALRTAINERISYWYGIVCSEIDDVHMRALIGDKISEEFYVKERYEQLQKDGVIPKDMDVQAMVVMRHCVTVPYNFDGWYWFYLDTGYYLAIPKNYAARYTASALPADILGASGFNPMLAAHRVDPLIIENGISNSISLLDQTIIPTMQTLMQQKDTTEKKYKWSLRIIGHGTRWETIEGYLQHIVGMTVARFKELCRWFDTHLSMHMLYVISCSSAGINRELFSNSSRTYTCPIVIENLGDMVAMIGKNSYDYLPDGHFPCRGYHLGKNTQTNCWELSYEIDQRYKKFFEKIHALPKKLDAGDIIAAQKRVFKTFVAVAQRTWLQNTPQLLLPHSTTWLLCYPSTSLYLNTQSSLLAEVCNKPILLNRESILIDAAVFNAVWQMPESNVKQIIAVSPGDTTHYVAALHATGTQFSPLLALFWPPMTVSSIKQLLFDEITCGCDPQDPLIKVMGITEKTVTFKKVILRIAKNERMDILFTVPNGDCYSASMRAIDGKPMVRNLQKLSPEIAASYYAHYAATKEELISSTDELYAPLRARYAQAMNAAQNAQAA